MEFLIIGKDGCPPCENAQELLNILEIDFEYMDVYESEGAIELVKSVGGKTTPQIWQKETEGFEWKYIGGFTDLKEYMKQTPQ